jgi:hypothetical protein
MEYVCSEMLLTSKQASQDGRQQYDGIQMLLHLLEADSENSKALKNFH